MKCHTMSHALCQRALPDDLFGSLHELFKDPTALNFSLEILKTEIIMMTGHKANKFRDRF